MTPDACRPVWKAARGGAECAFRLAACSPPFLLVCVSDHTSRPSAPWLRHTPLSAGSRRGVRRPEDAVNMSQAESSSSDLNTWLNTSPVSVFSAFLPKSLHCVTSSAILFPKDPRGLCNLHVNYFKNLVYCHFGQHRCLWEELVRGHRPAVFSVDCSH